MAENSLNAVERIEEYTHVESGRSLMVSRITLLQKANQIAVIHLPNPGPSKASSNLMYELILHNIYIYTYCFTIQRVEMKYRPGLPSVLRNVSFQINAQVLPFLLELINWLRQSFIDWNIS